MYLKFSMQQERFGLCFWNLNDREKGTTNAFNSYKLTSKLCLMHLQVKLQRMAVAFSNKNALKR